MTKISNLKNSRLALRFTLYVVVASTFISIFTSAFQIYSEYRRDVNALESSITAIEKTHLSNISSRVWVLDMIELKRAMQGIFNFPSMQYIGVHDNSGILVKMGEKKVKNSIVRIFPLHYQFHKKAQIIGSLHIEITLNNVYSHIYERAINIIVSNVIKTLFVSSIIILIFYQLVAKHLILISRFSNDMDINKLDNNLVLNRKKHQPKSLDELDFLCAALLSMQSRLKDSILKLTESESDLAITLNSIGDAVITTDVSGKITRMNPVAEQLTGWSLAEAQGLPVKSVLAIIDATTRETIENPVEKVLATGETVYLSNRTTLISKDGTEYQIADSAAPIRNGDDRILGMVLVFNDVTEAYQLRKKTRLAQNTIAAKEREQREILDSIVDAIITIDEVGLITTFNHTAVNLFGYTQEEIIGKNIKQLMPPSYSEHHDAYLDNYLKTGVENIIGVSREVIGLHKDSTTFDIRLSITELTPDEHGKRRFIGTCQDIRQIKLQGEQLRRSQKMDALGKLTGGIAHDYNNMLGVVLGYANLLQDKLSDQPKLSNYLKQIIHASERGSKLTKKLLSFSRQGSQDEIKLDINTLIQEERDLLEKTLTVRITLKLDLEEALWSVFLDEGELEDSLLNMSINAMHAMQDNGTLTIRTCNQTLSTADAIMLDLKPGDYVQLSLTDTGCGMSDAIKEKIFDPFFSTKGESGTGLGLSQVFGFVSRAGGTIKVYSEPSHGSQFILYFPRHYENEQMTTNHHHNHSADMPGYETLLIVDDEHGLRTLCTEILSQEGYTVFTAESGVQALTILKREKIDLMLTDIIMPKMDGYELAAIVKEKYPAVKIQLASGFAGDGHTGLVDGQLQANLLHKPYDSKTLLSIIRNLLDE